MQLRSGRIVTQNHVVSNNKTNDKKNGAIILTNYIQNVGGKLSVLEAIDVMEYGELKGKVFHSWSTLIGYALTHKYLKFKNDCLYLPSYLTHLMI